MQHSPQILGGTWACSGTIPLRLPSERQMNERYGSPEYQKIAKHRSRSNDITAVPAVATVGQKQPPAYDGFAAPARGHLLVVTGARLKELRALFQTEGSWRR